MYYHPLIGHSYFLGAVILSFFLGKYAFKKISKRNLNSENLELLKTAKKVQLHLKEKLLLLMLHG